MNLEVFFVMYHPGSIIQLYIVHVLKKMRTMTLIVKVIPAEIQEDVGGCAILLIPDMNMDIECALRTKASVDVYRVLRLIGILSVNGANLLNIMEEIRKSRHAWLSESRGSQSVRSKSCFDYLFNFWYSKVKELTIR